MLDLINKGIHEEVIIMTASDLEAALKGFVSEVIAEMQQENETRMITRQEARRRLDVDLSTLWRWDRAGYLKAHHRGKAVLYLEKDVEELEKGIVK